jgi:hypothetical protein
MPATPDQPGRLGRLRGPSVRIRPRRRRFPALTTLAAKAGVARSTAALAIKALEALGILTWAHRLRRDHDGSRWRVFRNSNAYILAGSAPERLLSPTVGTNRDKVFDSGVLSEALDRLQRARSAYGAGLLARGG